MHRCSRSSSSSEEPERVHDSYCCSCESAAAAAAHPPTAPSRQHQADHAGGALGQARRKPQRGWSAGRPAASTHSWCLLLAACCVGWAMLPQPCELCVAPLPKWTLSLSVCPDWRERSDLRTATAPAPGQDQLLRCDHLHASISLQSLAALTRCCACSALLWARSLARSPRLALPCRRACHRFIQQRKPG